MPLRITVPSKPSAWMLICQAVMAFSVLFVRSNSRVVYPPSDPSEVGPNRIALRGGRADPGVCIRMASKTAYRMSPRDEDAQPRNVCVLRSRRRDVDPRSSEADV